MSKGQMAIQMGCGEGTLKLWMQNAVLRVLSSRLADPILTVTRASASMLPCLRKGRRGINGMP